MEIYLIKGFDNKFTVAYDSDYEKLKKIKPDKMILCKITQPRNIGFHRKFMALIQMVFQNQEHYNSFDKLRRDLIKSAGFIDEHISIWGEVTQVAKSISFSSMDEDEFQELYNRVTDEIVKHFNFEKQSIIDNVHQFF